MPENNSDVPLTLPDGTPFPEGYLGSYTIPRLSDQEQVMETLRETLSIRGKQLGGVLTTWLSGEFDGDTRVSWEFMPHRTAIEHGLYNDSNDVLHRVSTDFMELATGLKVEGVATTRMGDYLIETSVAPTKEPVECSEFNPEICGRCRSKADAKVLSSPATDELREALRRGEYTVVPKDETVTFSADDIPISTRDDSVFDPSTGSETRVTNATTGAQKGAKAAKYNLIPVGALEELAKLYGFGATKYAPRNWERGYELSLSYDALQRHANQWWSGEDIDSETQLSHMASVAWHAFTLYTLLKTHPEMDDRPHVLKDENLDLARHLSVYDVNLGELKKEVG